VRPQAARLPPAYFDDRSATDGTGLGAVVGFAGAGLGAVAGRSSVPLAAAGSPPPTGTGPVSPSAAPSGPSVVPTPGPVTSGISTGDAPLSSPAP
jgi:hypothetical protein